MSQLLRIECVSKRRRGGRRTTIDDDALRHAERRVCCHLDGTQMTRWETEHAKFGGTVSWRVVACSSSSSLPSIHNTRHTQPRPPGFCLLARMCTQYHVVRTEDTLIKPARERNGIRMWEGERDARTPKRNHVNLPVSPSDGESAKDALGSSRHTRSWGILRDCINASTPCSWHSTCAAATGEAESEVVPVGGLALVLVVKAAEREALVALERFVKATDAPGPASVRMCYDYGT